MGSTFAALRHPNYRTWFIGQTISLIGTWMQTMAQQVLIYRLTNSAAALGIVSFIALIPLIPLSLWGGSISDRISKRSILLVTQASMLVQALLLGVLTGLGHIQIWHVYVLAFVLGAANAVDLPTRQAFTVEMVERKEDLTNAVALNAAMFNMARAVGPAMAGVIVAATGESMAFFLNALTFVAVIISLLLMRNLPRPVHRPGEANLLAHMGEGIRYVRGQQVMMVLISIVAVSAFLSMPYNTLMPVFADVVLKASAAPVIGFICGGGIPIHCVAPQALPLGLLLGAVGVGAVIGALYIASMPYSARRGMMLAIGSIGFPLILLFFALSRSFLASLGLMLMMGFVFTWQNSLANTLLQLLAPDEMRGRVMSFYTLAVQMMMRLGGLQAGYMADWFGAPFALGIGAVVSIFYGAYIAIRYPRIREM